MTTWLIYPPLADPTQPYGSLPLLKGYLRARGLDATLVDMNLAAAHQLLGREPMRETVARLAERFDQLNGRERLGLWEQLEYLALAEARPAAARFLSAGLSPVEILRDPDRFYQLNHYRRARDLAEDALFCAGAVGFPYSFHFNRAAHLAVPWGRQLLEAYYHERRSPLDAWYRSFLARCRPRPGDVVGISLTFISQIPETFYLLQLIRDLWPGVLRVIGGSCLQQMLCHAPEEVQRWIVTTADAACVAEGEQTLAHLLAVLNEAGPLVDAADRAQKLARVPNLLTRDGTQGSLRRGPVGITALADLPMPDFSDLDLDGYLAPERTLLFAPTRGCYWNRCSFCDYGLNRSGLHGYREMTPALAAEQMADLAERYAVDHLYLSVDVLTPHFAEALSAELIARRATVRWSTDLRLDPTYTAECCARLFQSGLRAAAFGVESGSDGLLRQMCKGLSVDTMRAVNDRFHQAGIATAWMMFSGHPGESPEQALASIRLIDEERARVDQFIVGRFGLTSGADIAARPQRYGLRKVFYCAGDDFRLFPLYEMQTTPPRKGARQLENALERLSRRYYLDHYPWAGAISTHHSLLYLLKFGPSVFRSLRLKASGAQAAPIRPKRRLPRGLTCEPAYDLSALRRARERFLRRVWRTGLACAADGRAPLTLDFFNQALQNAGPAAVKK